MPETAASQTSATVGQQVPQPFPAPPTSQNKTARDAAESFWKAAMASGFSQFDFSNRLSQWNSKRAAAEIQSGILPSQRGSLGDTKCAIDDVIGGESDMRVDSDDIHYHFVTPPATSSSPNSTQSSLLSGLLKAGAGIALAGTGIGIPVGISAIPDILKAIGQSQPAVISAPQGDTSKPVAPEPINVWGIRVGSPD